MSFERGLNRTSNMTTSFNKETEKWTHREPFTIKKENKVEEVLKEKNNVMAENDMTGKHKVYAHLCILQLGIVDLWDKLIGRLPQLLPWLILLYPVGLMTGTQSTLQIDEHGDKTAAQYY